MPLVSVCIPSYNRPDLLKRCLDSVLSQTFRDFEVIISDDSTNDEIKELLKTYSDKRIRYQLNRPSLGSPKNWNKAMDLASGELIKILHHDDYFTNSESLNAFVSEFSDKEVNFVCCASKILYLTDHSTYENQQSGGQVKRIKSQPEFLFYRNVIGAPSAVLFRNKREIRFDPDYKWLVDVEFYVRYIKKFNGFRAIPSSLVTVVAGETGQITESITKDRARVVRENVNLFTSFSKLSLNESKSILYFQELFDDYQISSFSDLIQIVEPKQEWRSFFEKVFAERTKDKLFKRIKKRLLTSRYNKRFFKIERF